MIKYFRQYSVKSCSKLVFLCNRLRICRTHGEGWRSLLESVVTRSERSVVGCTHSGGGSGLKEDIHLRRVIECEFGYRFEGFGNGNLELLVKGKWWIRFRSEAEKGILRSFFIWIFRSVMIIAGKG